MTLRETIGTRFASYDAFVDPLRGTDLDTQSPRPAALRIGLRFVVAYFVIYTFPGFLGIIPLTGGLFGMWGGFMSRLSVFVGQNLLGITRPMPIQPTGSGDTMVAYVSLFTMSMLALIIAGAWFALDRKKNRDALYARWFNAYIRFTLATILFSYGFAKVYQAQFPPLSPERLVQTLGEMSPMGLVWTFMAYSKAYNVFAGLGEVLGGALVCFRRTRMLGAIVSIAVMANVVALNFMYDVPVKLYSAHIVAMAVIVAAPDFFRLIRFFLLNKSVPANDEPRLWAEPSMHRVAVGAMTLIMGYTAAMDLARSRQREQQSYAAPITSPFWGVYDVTEIRRNGTTVPLLVTDSTMWRRIAFGSFTRATVRLMGDSALRFTYQHDSTDKSLRLVTRVGTTGTMEFTYTKPDARELILTSRGSSDSLVIHLRKSDKDYLLTSRGYNWVQELPFNR